MRQASSGASFSLGPAASAMPLRAFYSVDILSGAFVATLVCARSMSAPPPAPDCSACPHPDCSANPSLTVRSISPPRSAVSKGAQAPQYAGTLTFPARRKHLHFYGEHVEARTVFFQPLQAPALTSTPPCSRYRPFPTKKRQRAPVHTLHTPRDPRATHAV